LKKLIAVIAFLLLTTPLAGCEKRSETKNVIADILSSEANLLESVTISELGKSATRILRVELTSVSDSEAAVLTDGSSYSRLTLSAEVTAAVRGGTAGETLVLEAPVSLTASDGTVLESAFRGVWYAGNVLRRGDTLTLFGMKTDGMTEVFLTVDAKNNLFLLLPENAAVIP